jgi:hypothetical protein
MTAKRLKRPRDPVQLGKLIGDILTGAVEDKTPEPSLEGKDAAAVSLGREYERQSFASRIRRG